MADALWMKIREIDWTSYPTSDGSNVPSLLRNLASRKLPRAMRASHQVWTALCDGGVLHPAAIPAAPFLVETMMISDPGVQDGILDILVRMVTEGGDAKVAVQNLSYALKPYLRSKDEIVSSKVKDLLASISE